MNQEQKDMLYDLLAKKAVHGLVEQEQRELEDLDGDRVAEKELLSLELAAAAVNQAGLDREEPLPANLFSKIKADAAQWVGAEEKETASEPWPAAKTASDLFSETPRRSSLGWLGWVAAAAACIALAVNIYLTRVQPRDEAKVTPTPFASPTPAPRDMMAQFEATTPDMVRASFAPGNVKTITEVTGEVVWSDAKQTGYIRLRNLPANDAAATCYQLWIFDKVQDKATPIDGGIFDVARDGEIVIPITAKLKAEQPAMFALTIERHGGVVVSKRDKIAAIAKVSS